MFWIKQVSNEDMGAAIACQIVCRNLDISQPFIYTNIKDCYGLKQICITSITAQYNFDLKNVRNLFFHWLYENLSKSLVWNICFSGLN